MTAPLMTEPPTAHQPAPPDPTAPEDGGQPATLEWLLDLTHASVLPVDRGSDLAVMAAAWALGFAGATRLQVWWVLRDERLRRAYGSIVRALQRVRRDVDPVWGPVLAGMAPAARAELAAAAAALAAGEAPTRVPATQAAVHAACLRHPHAVQAPDRSYVAVPAGALDALAAAARWLTPQDVELLLQRAHGPFADRLAEADRLARDGVALHARIPGRSPRVA